MQNLIIIESSCVGASYSGRAAELLGYRPVFLTDLRLGQGDVHKQMNSFAVIDCDTTNVEKMKTALIANATDDIAAVVSFSDTTIMDAIALARELNVTSMDGAVERLKDKFYAYKMIPEFSPTSIYLEQGNIPLDQLRDLLHKNKRLIIKPCCSAGGHGNFFINDSEPDLEKFIETKIRESNIPKNLKPESWIAQTVLDGRLVSLEGFCSGGTPHFLGFSGRKKIGNAESVIDFPVQSGISTNALNDAKKAATQLFKNSGFSNGWFHIEFILIEGSAKVIDANIGRVGGGGLSQQFSIAYQIAPEKIYAHILALALGAPEKLALLDIDFSVTPTRTLSVMYGIPEKATLECVDEPEEFPLLHTVLLDKGYIVEKMGVDNYSWVGILTGTEPDVLAFADFISIRTDKGKFRPIY